MRNEHWKLTALAFLVLALPSSAEDTLKVKGMGVLRGEVTAYDEAAQIVTFVTTDGKEQKIPNADLDRLSAYQLAKSKVDPNDPEAELKLGNFARDIELYAHANRHYGKAEKISPELKEKVVVTVNRELTQANIILGHIGIERSNPDYYAVSVMNYIFGGGGFASRLMTRIRDDMGLAYDVHSFFTSDRDKGVFQTGVQTKNESAKTVIEVILEEMRRIQKEPVTDEELKDARAYLTGSFPRRLDTMDKIANFLALTEFYNLGIDYDKRYPVYINSVTRDDILRVAGKYLNPERYVLVVVADLKKAGFLPGKR